MRKFSYEGAESSEVIQETIQISLSRSLVQFREWLDRRSRDPKELRFEFEVWWRLQGPLNFTSFEDSRRYREELWMLISQAA